MRTELLNQSVNRFMAQPWPLCRQAIVAIELHYRIGLTANTPAAPIAIMGHRGFQIIGAGAKLHRIGQAFAGCRHIHLSKNRTGLFNQPSQ